jgi:hypothetical protein
MEHLDMQFGAPISLPNMERKAQMFNYTLASRGLWGLQCSFVEAEQRTHDLDVATSMAQQYVADVFVGL